MYLVYDNFKVEGRSKRGCIDFVSVFKVFVGLWYMLYIFNFRVSYKVKFNNGVKMYILF